MTQHERQIIIGSILGDAFLQKTGEKNARIRFEHSFKQRAYIVWKWQELKRYMQDRPKLVERWNPVWKKSYRYFRCQSHASPEFGKLRRLFYPNGRKTFPRTLSTLLNHPLALAVWFMDDGYYYARDRTAYLYLAHITRNEEASILEMFRKQFSLKPRIERKKNGSQNLKFSVIETRQFNKIIAPHCIPAMRYKLNEEPRID